MMRKLLFIAISGIILTGFVVACGDLDLGSESSHGHNTNTIPQSGYYEETTRFINNIEVMSGSYYPKYVWVDGVHQQIHYKDHDHNSNMYNHSQHHFNDHVHGGSNHNSGGHGKHKACLNISYGSYETKGIDSNGNNVRSVFTRITKEVYDSVLLD